MTLQENLLHKTKYKGSYSQGTMSTNLFINLFQTWKMRLTLLGNCRDDQSKLMSWKQITSMNVINSGFSARNTEFKTSKGSNFNQALTFQ